ncbi:hypothetical protein [Alysiella crassa]|uniref:hypothetical protein n=1 Tax=Alysiella crassa TaxID=153491 RepID=UPI00054DADCE|nr:hypothetical protein [Alysiella crassa]UOP06251.1 hypothetical protein LVJ80_10570 [Alysiella crassa]
MMVSLLSELKINNGISACLTVHDKTYVGCVLRTKIPDYLHDLVRDTHPTFGLVKIVVYCKAA